MFVLHGVIELLLNKSKPVFCSFVDLQRAFDSTHRNALWFKLSKYNVSSKIIRLVKNMYSKIKLSVRNVASHDLRAHNASDIGYFTSKAGVFQGESLSPFMFSMFLNDLNDVLQSNEDVGISLEHWLLTVLLFADDMVLFSTTRPGLQSALDALGDYCDKWGLTVNVNKTKCIAFKKGGKIGALDK